MKKVILRAALLSGAVLVASPALADHWWGGYHWSISGSELNLDVVDAVGSQWDSALNTAISDWNQSTVLNFTKVSGAGVNAKKCSPQAGKIVVCNALYGQRGWLGIAQIWLSNGHISQGTTKLNDTYYNTPTYNTAAWRALVTCQEIAHDVGLDHQDENFSNANLGTCMDYTNSPGTNQHPNQHDYDMLEEIYSHSHAAQTNFAVREVGKAPASSGVVNEAPGGDSPAEWGRAIHFDGQGRPDVYLQDLGGGRKKITHVFWAVGKGPAGEHHHE
jgi:hypothetical protein